MDPRRPRGRPWNALPLVRVLGKLGAMTFASAATDQSKSAAAIGGGILAGLVTLAIVGGALWLTRDDSGGAGANGQGATGRIGTSVAGAGLQPSDCFNFDSSAAIVTSFAIVACATPHQAQVAGKIEHPEAGGVYPGSDAMTEWIGDQCAAVVGSFIARPILDTTLADGALPPNRNDWTAGDYNAVCYVAATDGASLTGDVEGRGIDHTRGDQVVVSRLKLGDCFQPADGTAPYDLNSNSLVALVDCDAPHIGVFFGRGRLPSPIGAPFPGVGEVGDTTSRQCGELFQRFFGVAADGFNYRYWRPNEQSWAAGDRLILCAILDQNPLEVRFAPTEYQRLFELAPGTCFNLGPEETSESLRLDDQVRRVPCDEAHIGQMLGSGNLANPETEPFPPDEGVLDLAGAECEALFTDFIGISPFESQLGNFPFWYPNQSGWEAGDRRYACAFLEDTPRGESLEGAGI